MHYIEHREKVLLVTTGLLCIKTNFCNQVQSKKKKGNNDYVS